GYRAVWRIARSFVSRCRYTRSRHSPGEHAAKPGAAGINSGHGPGGRLDCGSCRGFAAGHRRHAHARRQRLEESLTMAIPVIYNVRSVKARWTSTIVAVLGIAGTVGAFVAMLSLARGFRATLVSSGSADNALITRAGATSEMTSGVSIDSVKIIQDAPGIARGAGGPFLTREPALMGPTPLRSTGTDANVELRRVAPNVLATRSNIKITEGRMF